MSWNISKRWTATSRKGRVDECYVPRGYATETEAQAECDKLNALPSGKSGTCFPSWQEPGETIAEFTLNLPSKWLS